MPDDLPALPWDLIREQLSQLSPEVMDKQIERRMFEALTAAVPPASTSNMVVTGPGGPIPVWKIRDLLGLAQEDIPLHDPELLEEWLAS